MGKYSDEREKPFLEKNKRHKSFCIYCGAVADTREHVPSKVFLDDPLPNDVYAIAPACVKCNTGYSLDELYVASLVNMVFCALNTGAPIREKIKSSFEHDRKFETTMYDSVSQTNGNICIEYSPERMERILTKLALGHFASKLDVVYDRNKHDLVCQFRFKSELTFDEMNAFEELPVVNKVSEVGADYIQDILVLVDIVTGEQTPISPWHEIQKNNYRFLAYVCDDFSYLIRIVIMEILYAEIIIKDKAHE